MNVYNIINELQKHPTKQYKKRKISNIKKLVIHHSLTYHTLQEDSREIVDRFAKYHIEHNGWAAIGYHYVIGRDGKIYKTNNASIWTYHVGKHNRYSLGILMTGDMRTQTPTNAQYDALLRLTQVVKSAYCPSKSINNCIVGHSELSGYEWKECPEIDMDQFRGNLKSNG